MMELSSDHFSKLSQQIYIRLGLQFEDKKLYFLQKRVDNAQLLSVVRQVLGEKSHAPAVEHDLVDV